MVQPRPLPEGIEVAGQIARPRPWRRASAGCKDCPSAGTAGRWGSARRGRRSPCAIRRCRSRKGTASAALIVSPGWLTDSLGGHFRLGRLGQRSAASSTSWSRRAGPRPRGIQGRQGHGAQARAAGRESLARLQRRSACRQEQLAAPTPGQPRGQGQDDSSLAQRAGDHQRIALGRAGQGPIAVLTRRGNRATAYNRSTFQAAARRLQSGRGVSGSATTPAAAGRRPLPRP